MSLKESTVYRQRVLRRKMVRKLTVEGSTKGSTIGQRVDGKTDRGDEDVFPAFFSLGNHRMECLLLGLGDWKRLFFLVAGIRTVVFFKKELFLFAKFLEGRALEASLGLHLLQ